MSEQQSIKDTLNVIKKALEDDESILEENDSNVLILNKLVKDDGTIHFLENKFLEKEEVKEILNQKFSEIFEKRFDKWLDKNVPNYLDKYFKKK